MCGNPDYSVLFLLLFSFLQLGTNMVEYLTDKTTAESPHIVMLGKEGQCSQAYVVIKGHALEHASLLGAVDGCFKAFYVLDINYPPQCTAIWEFFQAAIYDIPGTIRSNAAKFLKAQISRE